MEGRGKEGDEGKGGGCPVPSAAAGATAAQREKVEKARGGGLKEREEKRKGGRRDGREEGWKGERRTRGRERRWSEVSGVHDLTSGAPSFRGALEADRMR